MRYDRMKIGVEIPTKFKFNDNTECWRSDDLSSEPKRFHIFHDFYAALIRWFLFYRSSNQSSSQAITNTLHSSSYKSEEKILILHRNIYVY